MQQTRFPPGALGLAAISAIDHCLWDISAKALGVPGLHAARRQCARQGEGLCRRLHRARSGRGARRVRPAERAMGPDGVQAQPLPDRHARASLGRGGAHRRPSIFASCARRCAPTTRSPSTRMPRSSRSAQAHAARQRACALRSAVLRGAAPAGELRGLGRAEARARLHAGDRRVALQPLRVPAAAAGAGAATSSSPTSASSAACWRCARSPRSPRRIT